MRSLLIVTRHTPLPWDDGAGAYLHDLAAFLARAGFRVDLLWLAPHEDLRWRKIWKLPDTFDASVHLHLSGAIRCGRRYLFPGMIWYPLQAQALHQIRRILAAIGLRVPRRRPSPATASVPPTPQPWMRPPSPDEFAQAARFIRGRRPDVVVASYAWMCPLFALPGLRSAHRVCLAHDVAWQRAQLAASEAGGEAVPEITRANEAAWLQAAETIVAISELDAVELQKLAPAARVLVAPKAGDVQAAPPTGAAPVTGRLLFVGSGNAFNVEGLTWFLRDVWPQVLLAVPGATLDVCGWIDRAVPTRPDGVIFHGPVPDLAPFYREAAVVIVPLRRASGLNIKLVDAASAGRAIVTTSATLAGAPFLRDAVRVADTTDSFAAEIVRLLADPAANREAANRALLAVHAHLSPHACYGPLTAHLHAAH